MSDEPPTLSERDEEILEHAQERYPAEAPPEAIDEEQLRQGRLVEREKEWVEPREIVGGEDQGYPGSDAADAVR